MNRNDQSQQDPQQKGFDSECNLAATQKSSELMNKPTEQVITSAEKRNKELELEHHLAQAQKLINNLKAENTSLKTQLQQ